MAHPAVAEKANLANDARRDQSRGRNRGRGRGQWRGRGRGRGNGGYNGGSHNRSGRDDRNRNESSSSGPPRVAKRSECKFCLAKGYWEQDCHRKKDAARVAQQEIAGRGRQDRSRSRDGANCVEEVDEYNNPIRRYPSPLDESAYMARETISAIALLSIGSNEGRMGCLDSGATRHFTGLKDDLIYLRPFKQPRKVSVANNSEVSAIGFGDVKMGKVVLKDVWYVPDFGTTRLISVRTLTPQGLKVLFEGETATGTKGGEWVFTATPRNNLYCVTSLTINPKEEEQARIAQALKATADLQELKMDLWHRRLGHASRRDIEKLYDHIDGMEKVRYVQPVGKHACEICSQGKIKQAYNKTTSSGIAIRLRKLHCDISGIKEPSVRGFRYYLIVVDDATRMSWVFLLKGKSTQDILPIIRRFKTKIQIDTGPEILEWQCDNGKGEFGLPFQDMLNVKGMRFKPCPPNEHAYHGVCEQAIYRTDCMARCLMIGAGLSPRFWCLATEQANWLRSGLPTRVLPFENPHGSTGSAITPYSAFTFETTDVSKIRVFGRAATKKDARDIIPGKYTPRAINNYIFVGMQGSKLWLLWNLLSNKLEVSGNAEFDEYHIPYDEYSRAKLETPKQAKAAKPPSKQKKGKKMPANSKPSQEAAPLDTQLATDQDGAPSVSAGRASPPRAIRVPHDLPTRSGRLPHTRVFNNTVAQAMAAFESPEEHQEGGIPTVPLEAVKLEEAIKSRDAALWPEALRKEANSLKAMNTLTIMRGGLPVGKRIISCRGC